MGYEKHKRPLVAPSFTPNPTGIALADLAQGTDGQLPIAQTGLATAYKSTSGDVTIDKNGVLTVGAGKVTGAKHKEGASFNAVVVTTNGQTPVNVFGAGGAPCALTILGAFIVSQDTTTGNITLQQASNTVFTAAKGSVAGVFVDSGTISNAVYAAADVCTVLSSSGGNAKVYIFFKVA